MGTHRRDVLLVDTVSLELAVGNAREKSKRLGEHHSVKPGIVLREQRFELAWCPPVEQRVHLAGGSVVWVQHGSDIKDDWFPTTPEDAEVYLAGFAVWRADHHLNKIACAAGDVNGELVSAERRHDIGLDRRRSATVQAEQINVLGRGAAMPWSWTA